MKYDGILIGLYILALLVIVVEFFSMLALTVVLVLLVIMLIVQKTGLERMVKSAEDERNKRLDEIVTRIEEVSKKADNFKEDLNRQVVFVDNKTADVRHFVEVEMNNVHNELSRKLADIDGRLSELRHGFAVAIGSFDERIRNTEKREDDSAF